jgi:hypothetical protein
LDSFIHQHHDKISGVLNGFDRLLLQGVLRTLSSVAGMASHLQLVGTLLKNFGGYVEQKSQALRAVTETTARQLGRPLIYLESSARSKEELARTVARQDDVRSGLICVFQVVEPCQTFGIRKDPLQKKLVLTAQRRKCSFYYHYWIDPRFGFMHGRIQTWFPFLIRVCLNGREWLARQMDAAGLRYHREDNCFSWIEDVAAAQRLLDEQVQLNWPQALAEIDRRLFPNRAEVLAPYRCDYYWSAAQSEWASDIMFRSPADLTALYPALVRNAIQVLGCRDVLRFLGKRPSAIWAGKASGSLKQYPEGMRIKYWVKDNSIKLYDKAGGRVLRSETTLNDVRAFRVFRPSEGHPDGPNAWRPMRKGVADLHRRAQLSQAANERFMDAVAALDASPTVQAIVQPLTRRKRWKHRPVRALRPWSPDDQALLSAIAHGRFTLQGFRNRDLVECFYGRRIDPVRRKRAAAQMTARLRILRAHGLIRKIPHTHRYQTTAQGKKIMRVLLRCYHLSLEQLERIVA